ncbi:MAG: DUF1194 domain-containing protein [Alphaproteobacteria bacterium]|nr:DUF1194 domain-containing protein [Alphaproteobacteria bacterium]NDG04321.1 DUF1194 domain-containing protein [Alphaproteobacteria bacterium]
MSLSQSFISAAAALLATQMAIAGARAEPASSGHSAAHAKVCLVAAHDASYSMGGTPDKAAKDTANDPDDGWARATMALVNATQYPAVRHAVERSLPMDIMVMDWNITVYPRGWTYIQTMADFDRWAEALANNQRPVLQRTYTVAALGEAHQYLLTCPHRGPKTDLVINLVTDGPASDGAVTHSLGDDNMARRAAQLGATHVRTNILLVLGTTGSRSVADKIVGPEWERLKGYYEMNVTRYTGGVVMGAHMSGHQADAVQETADFMARKLILDVVGGNNACGEAHRQNPHMPLMQLARLCAG